MTVTLPPDLESRVAERARAEGISNEAFVEKVVRQATSSGQTKPGQLPRWQGHVLGDLRRQDLYDDVR